jgi:hypothetical protein
MLDTGRPSRTGVDVDEVGDRLVALVGDCECSDLERSGVLVSDGCDMTMSKGFCTTIGCCIITDGSADELE